MAEGKVPKTKRLTAEALEDSFGSEDDSGDSNSSDSSSADSQLVSVAAGTPPQHPLIPLPPARPSPLLDAQDQEVQVDFEARQVEEGDYHGIRRLLQQV